MRLVEAMIKIQSAFNAIMLAVVAVAFQQAFLWESAHLIAALSIVLF